MTSVKEKLIGITVGTGLVLLDNTLTVIVGSVLLIGIVLTIVDELRGH